MTKGRQIKIFIVALGLYLLIGLALFCTGQSSQTKQTAEDERILINEDAVSFRIIGKDYELKQIEIPIAEYKGTEEDELHVYFTKGEMYPDGENIAERIFVYNQLCDMESLVMSFTGHCMTFDRDYYLTFILEKGDGTLALYKSDNISIGEGIYNVAYTAELFRHSSKWLFIWRFLLVVGGVALAISMIKGISLWRSLGIFTVIEGLLMYVLMYIDQIKWVVAVNYIITAMALGWLVYYLIQKPERLTIDQDMIGQGLTWLALIGMFLLHDRNLHIYFWDEGSHWATAAKNMYLFDQMFIHPKSTVTAISYPPMFTLFQYFVLKLSGIYSDALLHFGKHFLETSVLLWLFDRNKEIKNSKLFYFFIMCVVILLPDVAVGSQSSRLFNLVYADITLGIMYGLVVVKSMEYIERPSIRSWWLVVVATLLMILTKDNGMILWASLVAGLICVVIYKFIVKEKPLTECKVVFASTLGFVIARVTYEVYIKNHLQGVFYGTISQISTVKKTGLSIEKVFEFLKGDAPHYRYAIIKPHIWTLLSKTYYEEFGVSFSIVMFFIICIACLCILKCINRWNGGKLIERAILLTGSFMGVIGIYHIVYTFTLSEAEAVVFASESRYMASFFLGMLIWLVWLFIRNASEVREVIEKKSMIIICGTLLVFSGFGFNYLVAVREGTREDIVSVRSNKLREYMRESERFFFVSNTEDGGNHVNYRYYLAPMSMCPSYFLLDNGLTTSAYIPRISAQGEYEYQLSVDEFDDTLDNYNYLYIESCDERFYEDYKVLFDEDSIPVNGWLFEIEHTHSGNIIRKYAQIF